MKRLRHEVVFGGGEPVFTDLDTGQVVPPGLWDYAHRMFEAQAGRVTVLEIHTVVLPEEEPAA